MKHVSRTCLPALAAAAFALGLAAIVAVAAGAVGSARDHAAGNEARIAASLWELPSGGAQAVARFVPGRAAIRDAEDPGTEPGAGAYGYEPGALDPAVWIAIDPEAPSAAWPRSAAALALSAALLMVAWAARRRRIPPPPRYPAPIALLAAGLIVLVAGTAKQWADRELVGLSAVRAAQATRAVEIAITAGADPDRAARLAGLPGAAATAPERPEPLVVVPGYEETASPGPALAASATGAAILVAVLLSLLPLSARPRALRHTLTAWGFLAPAAVLLLIFTFGPLLMSLWISLHEWHLVDPVHPFTGLANYGTLLLDGAWWSAIGNTAVFTLHVPFAMAVALGLALLTRGSRRAVRWARLALFLPGITSVAAIAVVWKWLLDDGYGLVNRALDRAGFEPVPWLTSPDTALASLMLISVWMVVGYQMVVFQAGLAAIPRDWYDAARVDGAGPLQRFVHITLPGLRHTLFFVLVTSVIGSFQVFGLVYVMTEGGPLGATDVAVYHIYREAWEFLRFGSAAAMSWVLFAVVFAATWLHFRFLEGRRAGAQEAGRCVTGTAVASP